MLREKNGSPLLYTLFFIFLASCTIFQSSAFNLHNQPTTQLLKSSLLHTTTNTRLSVRFILKAKPKRLVENADGVLYVNNRCINCSACENFAPSTFGRSVDGMHHVVHTQPSIANDKDIREAREALSACPVAAIRITTTAELHHTNQPPMTKDQETLVTALAPKKQIDNDTPLFPKKLVQNVYYLGHHNEKSFGAMPYLVQGKMTTTNDGKNNKILTNVMVDVPKFSPSAVRTVTSLTGNDGPDFMFLTHIDDTADHQKWKERFPKMKRIIHHLDTLPENNWLNDNSLNDSEIVLFTETNHQDDFIQAWTLNGISIKIAPSSLVESLEGGHSRDLEVQHNEKDQFGNFIIIHTPGHSAGSISLLYYFLDNAKDNIVDPSLGQLNDKRIGVFFTGDTYAFTSRDGGRMTGFPRYGNDTKLQAETISNIIDTFSEYWDVIAPGHGHVRNYIDLSHRQMMEEKTDLRSTVKNLKKHDIAHTVNELKQY